MDATRRIQIAIAWADIILAHARAALPFVIVTAAIVIAAAAIAYKRR